VPVSGSARYDEHGRRYCTSCKAFLPVEQFGRSKAIKDGLHIYCKSCNTKKSLEYYRRNPDEANRKRWARTKRWRESDPARYQSVYDSRKRRTVEVKQEIFAAYGGKCTCCGEDTFAFLSIDHINNDGSAQRKIHGVGFGFYQWIKRQNYPEDLQILCFNCNLARGFYGACPHQERREINNG
jgi:hypothetical protein